MAEVLAIISLTGRSHCDKPGTPYIGVENNLAAFRRLDPNWIANTPEDSKELAFTTFWNEYYRSDGGFRWMDGNELDSGTPSYLTPPTNNQTSQDFGLSWESLIGDFSLNFTSNELPIQARSLTFSHVFNFTQVHQKEAGQPESATRSRCDYRPVNPSLTKPENQSKAIRQPIAFWSNVPNRSATVEATSAEKPIQAVNMVPARVYKLRGNLVLVFLFLTSSFLLVVTWILWVWRVYKSRRDFETFVSLLREGEPVIHQLSGNRRRSNRNRGSNSRATHKLRVHIPDAPVESRFQRIYRFFYWNLLGGIDLASRWNQRLRFICDTCVCRWREVDKGSGLMRLARRFGSIRQQGNVSVRRMKIKAGAYVEITSLYPVEPKHRYNHLPPVTTNLEILMVPTSRSWSPLLEQVRIDESHGGLLLPVISTPAIASNQTDGELLFPTVSSTLALTTLSPSESSSSMVPSNSPPPGFEFLLQEDPHGNATGVWGSFTTTTPSLPKYTTSSSISSPSSQIRRDLGAMIYILTGETLTPEAIEMLMNADSSFEDLWNQQGSTAPPECEWEMDANTESL